MPEFYTIIARKVFFTNFRGHVPRAPCPTASYTYDNVWSVLERTWLPSVHPPVMFGSGAPRNLYGRDGKFGPTFKSGTEKRRFSVPLLMT